MLKNKTTSRKSKGEKGQSLLEFALMLPMLIMMFHLLLDVEKVISTSIVNQKYARGTLNFLMFNHRYYIEWKNFLKRDDGTIMRRYWTTVDDNVNYGRPDLPKPVAPIRRVGPANQANSASDEAQTEYPDIDKRHKVRVRVTAFSCIPPLALDKTQLLAEGSMREGTFVGGGPYKFCDSNF